MPTTASIFLIVFLLPHAPFQCNQSILRMVIYHQSFPPFNTFLKRRKIFLNSNFFSSDADINFIARQFDSCRIEFGILQGRFCANLNTNSRLLDPPLQTYRFRLVPSLRVVFALSYVTRCDFHSVHKIEIFQPSIWQEADYNTPATIRIVDLKICRHRLVTEQHGVFCCGEKYVYTKVY